MTSSERLNQWMKEKEDLLQRQMFSALIPPSRWRLWWKSFTRTVCFHLPASAQTLCHTLLPLSQMDHDPRNPTYISSQGPLPSTVADFWQVILISIDCGLSSFTVLFPQRWGFGRTTAELHYAWPSGFVWFTNCCVILMSSSWSKTRVSRLLFIWCLSNGGMSQSGINEVL